MTTASAYYLPLNMGNTWTFTTGASFVDEGTVPLTCACPENGAIVEQVALLDPGSSSPGGYFYFAKYTPSGHASLLTTLIGIQPAGQNMTITSTVQTPDGLPIMDDSPAKGESWSDGLGDLSTIDAVGGTTTITGNQQLINVASDTITGSATPLNWRFAKGVGFASISYGGQTTSLSSFTINAAQSTSLKPKSSVLGVPAHG
ncbi:MAG TPA: hypothetical protein VGD50_08280, partial [Candidatus Baltobacteraceae bacterium]